MGVSDPGYRSLRLKDFGPGGAGEPGGAVKLNVAVRTFPLLGSVVRLMYRKYPEGSVCGLDARIPPISWLWVLNGLEPMYSTEHPITGDSGLSVSRFITYCCQLEFLSWESGGGYAFNWKSKPCSDTTLSSI